MRSIRFALTLSLAFVLIAAVELVGSPTASAGSSSRACGLAGPNTARCHAQVLADRVGNFASTSPTGLDPAAIKSVYSFSTSSTAGAGTTIAIVDAYNDEHDLRVWRLDHLPGHHLRQQRRVVPGRLRPVQRTR